MKVKTSELIGPALDWAVAKCEGLQTVIRGSCVQAWLLDSLTKEPELLVRYHPSTGWAQGGPIIEREGVWPYPHRVVGTTEGGQEFDQFDGFKAHLIPKFYWMTSKYFLGPTPLIAAMRCRVASKLGDEVEVPDELMK